MLTQYANIHALRMLICWCLAGKILTTFTHRCRRISTYQTQRWHLFNSMTILRLAQMPKNVLFLQPSEYVQYCFSHWSNPWVPSWLYIMMMSEISSFFIPVHDIPEFCYAPLWCYPDTRCPLVLSANTLSLSWMTTGSLVSVDDVLHLIPSQFDVSC